MVWSGIRLCFGLDKPVLFVDVPRKINNPDYEEIEIEPFESIIRDKIGVIMDGNNCDLGLIKSVKSSAFRDDYCFQNPNKNGADILKSLIREKYDTSL